jgi:REP element-mobilizing transposase RayT
MARANRHYIPGYVWHITHRCHKREFLLKFVRDRRRWLQWLFEAKKRFGTRILNYTVTSNHIHLLIQDGGAGEVIPQTMQLVAGRTGQEYNLRKNRNGAYWEDRYHATAVEAGSHLIQCMVYIDLNMVRAGVVKHPSEYPFSGYNEIENPRERYGLIDHKSLVDLLNLSTAEALKESYRGWVEESLREEPKRRQPRWTESIAVGSEGFVENTKAVLGIKAIGRETVGEDGVYQLREAEIPYGGNLRGENDDLRFQNTWFWDTSDGISSS